jgi:hypothetical protein
MIQSRDLKGGLLDMIRFRALALVAVALAAVLLWPARPAHAQLWVMDQHYFVTELRPSKSEIGVSHDNDGVADRWVHIDKNTQIAMNVYSGAYRKTVMISPDQLWSKLQPGMRVKVHGGRRWDGNVHADKIWF